MEARAIAKYVRMSPMKVGVVLDLIRGKNVNEAFAILQYTPKDAAVVINKVLKSAVANAENAKKAWFEAAFESGVVIHEPDSLEEYSGQFKLRIPKSLHRSLAEHSKKEGISMNQYCVYLLAKNDAVYSK